MNNNIIQPAEIDRMVKEIHTPDEKHAPSLFEEMFINITTREIQRCAYISPYRAAYMRTHSLGGL